METIAPAVSPLAPVDLTGADPLGKAVSVAETPAAPAPTAKPASKTKKPARRKKPVSKRLDHDGDGRAGGAKPEPEVSHYVALKDDAERGFAHGEVLGLTSGQVHGLVKSEVVRPATAEEVELAQPFVRTLTA